jgi:bifunctional oligoribonuclease and PAP phosphatase NrnA
VSSIAWERFAEIVRRHQRFVLTAHVRPDCDTLGSQLALAEILETLGKTVLCCNPFEVPPGYRFLDAAGRLRRLGAEVAPEQVAGYDVLVVLDTTAWAQLGEMGEVIRAFPGVRVVIDHHVSEDDLGAESFKDVEADATGRLVVEAADALGVPLTPGIAQPAFAALATDTGWFRFSSARAETFQLAARLVEAGAMPDALYKRLYEEETLARLQLVGRAMARTRTELDGRLIHTSMRRDDFEATGALPADSEDVINMTLSVGGTEVAVIFVEQPGGGLKISFRSRCDVDCSQLARRFDGGGHKKASGAFQHGPFDEVQARVLDAVRAAMR